MKSHILEPVTGDVIEIREAGSIVATVRFTPAGVMLSLPTGWTATQRGTGGEITEAVSLGKLDRRTAEVGS